MKYLFIYALFFLPSLSYCRLDTLYPLVSISCGKSVRPSPSIVQIRNILDSGNLDSLKTLLNSKDASIKYLSIKVCEYLAEKKKLVLRDYDKQTIESSKQTSEKIRYCHGCKFRAVYTLKELFSDDTLPPNQDINDWIKKL